MCNDQSSVTAYYQLVKSVLDRFVVGIALLILSPVQLIVGIAIYLRMGRPILFTQPGVAKSGYLIEAIAKLLPQFPNLHTLIIGSEASGDPEPIKAELIERIRTLGMEKHVILTGGRADRPELLGLLDIFTLLTFTHDGLPRSLLEAMSMGLPVVATDIRGCREAVVHQETDLIVPPEDSEKLAEALGILLSDAELRLAYGQASRHRIESEYDEHLVFIRREEYYQKLGIMWE